MKNPFSLDGKTALVAGASRGIGLACARSFAQAGARTILASRDMKALEGEAAKLRDEGFQAEAAKLDVANSASIQECAAALPDVDILLNCAGINLRKKFETYTREEYDRVLQTNLHGIFELTQLVGKKMIERGKGGKVIFIGSMMSVLGLPYLSVYGITKSALWGLTRILAAEWGRHNIQVNCIAPGFILTDLNRDMWQQPVLKNWLNGAQANPKMGSGEDIGPSAVFLASPGADYITGQILAVDGGYSTTANWPFEPNA
ncbi:MAG TPA: SDR family oxidoreductase [Bryobacteraceae bacterium]|nr:SDR family oxidoreductase [Bryobacteraceae bacterium]